MIPSLRPRIWPLRGPGTADNHQVFSAVETNEAAKRVDRLQHKHAALNRRASVGRGLVKVLRETDLASFSSRQEVDIGKEAWADGEGGGFTRVAVWRETSSGSVRAAATRKGVELKWGCDENSQAYI